MSIQSSKNPIVKLTTILFTLSLGYLGAGLAQVVHLPVPALLGSGILLSLVAFTRLPLSMPTLMRNIGFTILGCSMGSSITPEMLAKISQWPLSLLGLALTVIAMMALSTWVLSHYFQQPKNTALLASTPGALSTVVALASDGKGDLGTVVVFQSLRLILVMASFPLIIHALGLQGSMPIDVKQPAALAWHTVPAVLLTAFATALMLDKIKLPAAYILSGLILSGTGHVGGWLSGNLPSSLVTLGFVIIGCVVGTRLKGMKLSELRSLSLAATISVILSSLIAAVGAAMMASALDLPFGQVWIAYAPGGIEAMAALALALHYDPAYIAAHHLSRIVAITLLMPLVARLLIEKGEPL
ncbi:AbrB family transcriptional regulator [uncultured Thiothrix sp.]|uniref:AbrB family transcriptional regulator n=1 Tax=uncultured Thiothrix sp. TaxID=223185 RepID=UPI002601871F|nr:AbrB family transcriptional regulator [uncultured Thiothrix sp.]